MSSNSSSCGCSAGCAVPGEPIVCTLAGHEQQARRANEFRDVFAHLDRTEVIDGAFRWFFRAQPELEARLRELAQREHDCCRFFDFRITRQGASVVWETRGPENAAAVLEEFMRLPQTLNGTPTLGSMKKVLAGAGLTFLSDRDEAP